VEADIKGYVGYSARQLALIVPEGYSKLDKAGQRKLARKAITAARKEARGLINDASFILPARGQIAPSGQGPWSGFSNVDAGHAGPPTSVSWDEFEAVRG